VVDYRCSAGPAEQAFTELHTGHPVSYLRKGSFGDRMRGASYELVAGEMVLSPFHFLRLFSRVPGVTPHQHLVRSRWGCVAEQRNP